MTLRKFLVWSAVLLGGIGTASAYSFNGMEVTLGEKVKSAVFQYYYNSGYNSAKTNLTARQTFFGPILSTKPMGFVLGEAALPDRYDLTYVAKIRTIQNDVLEIYGPYDIPQNKDEELTAAEFEPEETDTSTDGVTMSRTLLLEVSASPKNFTITYVTNGGHATAESTWPTNYIYGTRTTLPTAEDVESDYPFLGWYDNPKFNGAPVTEILSGDYSNKTYYAKWAACQISATVEPSAISANIYGTNVAGWVTGTGLWPSNETVILEAVPSQHWSFVRWQDGDTLSVREITAVTNATYTAIFTQVTYQVTAVIQPGGAGTVSGTGYYTYGALVVLAAQPYTGYEFTGWSAVGASEDDLLITENPHRILVKGDQVAETGIRSIQANFTATKYVVTLDSQGADIYGTQYVYATYKGTLPKLESLPKKGYLEFCGYYSLPNGKGRQYYLEDGLPAGNVWPVATNGTLYAYFKDVSYRVVAIVDPEDGGVVKGTGTYSTDTTVTLEAVPNEGYRFTGWGDTDDPTNPRTIENLSSSLVIKASFTGETYTVTLDADGAEIAGDYSVEVAYHAYPPALKVVPQKKGLVFYGYFDQPGGNGTQYYGADGQPAGNVWPKAEDGTLYAFFSDTRYSVSVTVSPEEGGTVVGAGNYSIGSVVTLTAQPETGYRFTSWEDGSTANPRTVTVTGSMALAATFTPETYTVILDNEGADVSGAYSVEVTYHGMLPALEVVPSKSGWYFGGYFEDENGQGRQYYLSNGQPAGNVWPVAEDGTLFAYWCANEYTVAFAANGGTGEMDNQHLEMNREVRLSPNAYTRTGYTFCGWDTHDAATNVVYLDQAYVSNLVSEVGGKITLYAVWSAEQYEVTLHAGNQGYWGTDSEQYYTTNVTVTTGEKATGWPVPYCKNSNEYYFNGWKWQDENNACWDLAPTIPAASANITNIVAQWKLTRGDTFAEALDAPELVFNVDDGTDSKGTNWPWVVDNEMSNYGESSVRVAHYYTERDESEADDYEYKSSFTVDVPSQSVLQFDWRLDSTTGIVKIAYNETTTNYYGYKMRLVDTTKNGTGADSDLLGMLENRSETTTGTWDTFTWENSSSNSVTVAWVFEGCGFSEYVKSGIFNLGATGWVDHVSITSSSSSPVTNALATMHFVEKPVAVGTNVYDGTLQTGVVVTNDDIVYVSGYTNATDAGTYKVTYSLKEDNATDVYRWEDYTTGSYTLEWQIAPRPVTDPGVKISLNPTSFHYTGEECAPTVTVTYADKELAQSNDYSVAYLYNVNVGKARAIVTGKGNFTGTETVEFKILPEEQKGSGGGATLCTLTFKANGGTVTPETLYVTNGCEVGTLPKATKENYEFSGWFTALYNGTEVTADTIVTNSATYYAHWQKQADPEPESEPDVWTVMLKANGGTVTPETLSVTNGCAVGTLPTPEREDYDGQFDGWYTDPNDGEKVSEDRIVTMNVTYYAHWSDATEPDPDPEPAAVVWTVTFDANGGTCDPTSRAVTNGYAVGTLPTPVRTDFVFTGWFTSAAGGAAVSAATVVMTDVTYYAQWEAYEEETSSAYGPWDPDTDVKNPNRLMPTKFSNLALTIYGEPAAAGDVLAAYRTDTDELCGLTKVTDPAQALRLVCYAPQGVTLRFNVWQAANEETLACDTTLTAPKAGTVDETRHELCVTKDASLFLDIKGNGWQTVSFNVLPDDPSPDNVFAAVTDKILTVVPGQGVDYWMPDEGGTLTDIEIGKAYWVNTTDGVAWTVTGKTQPSTEISLQEGWNLVGYAGETAGAIDTVLRTALNANVIEQIVCGIEFYPNGTLTTMTPGKAYWVLATKDYTLTYDSVESSSSPKLATASVMGAVCLATSSATASKYGPWDEAEIKLDPTECAVPTMLTNVLVSIDGVPAAQNDVVAAFRADSATNEVLCGLGKVLKDGTGVLTLVCYAPKGAKLTFKVWQAASGLEAPVILEAVADDDFTAPESGKSALGPVLTATTPVEPEPETPVEPEPETPVEPEPTYAVGLQMALVVGDAQTYKGITAKNLPAGVKLVQDKTTKVWSLVGVPTKGDSYNTILTYVAKDGTKTVVTNTFEIAALDVGAVGVFNGFLYADASTNAPNAGTLKVTATDKGKITAKVVRPQGTYSFSANGWNAVTGTVYYATLSAKNAATLTVALDASAAWNAAQVSGSFAVADAAYPLAAQRNPFDTKWQFRANGSASDGWTFTYVTDDLAPDLTVTVKANGQTSVAGTLGGIRISASGYADVSGLAAGRLQADFAPVVTQKSGSVAVKKVLSIRTYLRLDQDGEADVGSACLVP